MKLSIFALTNRHPDWINAGVAYYAKRFGRDFPLEIIDLRPENRQGSKPLEQLLELEATRLTDQLQKKAPRALLVALDERGVAWSTAQLSQWLEKQMVETPHIAFVIGSSDGLAKSIKQKADLTLRLSAMTLPHGLAKLLLVEQLYRATTRIFNHPYHRE